MYNVHVYGSKRERKILIKASLKTRKAGCASSYIHCSDNVCPVKRDFRLRRTYLPGCTGAHCICISLVKSILMYASTIWRPDLKINKARLERVQHNTRNSLPRFDHNYTAISETFSLPPVLSSMIASDN